MGGYLYRAKEPWAAASILWLLLRSMKNEGKNGAEVTSRMEQLFYT